MDSTIAMFARGAANKLASPPQVLLRLLEVYDSGVAEPARLAAIIAKDAALSAKILCFARGSVQAGGIVLENAIAAIGVDAIKSMAINAAGHPMLLRYGAQWHVHLQKLWARSLTCAMLAKALAQAVRYPALEEAYLAGLLHNIGQLVLGAYAPDAYPNLLAVERDGPKLVQLEFSHFNTSYYEAGAALVEEWDLQSFMADALRYQSEPLDRLHDAHPLVRILDVAHNLAAAGEARDDITAAAENLFPTLARNRMHEIMRTAAEEIGEAALGLGIRLGEFNDKPSGGVYELTNRVRHIAILDGISQRLGASRDENTLVEGIQRGIQILVGAANSFLLVHDAENDVLLGRSSVFRPRLVRELRLPAGSMRNLPSRALATGRITYSDADDEAGVDIADRQLLDLLQADAMVCVPLFAAEAAAVGVLVMAIDKGELPYPQERATLLREFGQRAARAIADVRQARMLAAPSKVDQTLERHVRQAVHEMRNPLTTVRNYVQILSKKYAGEEWAERDLKIIHEEIVRVESILRHLAGVSEGRETPPEPAPINRIIFDLMWVLQASILDACNVKADLDLADDVPPLPVDTDGLKQVITNLVGNACDAMPEGGEITVRTRANINIDGRLYVELSIGDSGRGIPPEIMEHLFERGATSKSGEHAGLGLAIVREIVQSWGGSMSVRSTSEGATFNILMPYRQTRIMPGEATNASSEALEKHSVNA